MEKVPGRNDAQTRMSIRIMNAIWQEAEYGGNTLLTLLALADWANDDGVCWPNIEQLAKKCRQSVRSAQYAIKQFITDGILEAEVVHGKGRRNTYRIKVQNLHHLKRCNLGHEKVQNTTPKGAKRDSAIRKNHQEPSNNHQADLICPKCGGKGTWEHKGHPGMEVFCWCSIGQRLQAQHQEGVHA